MSKPIALILGAGKNIGASTAKAFLGKGYRVAQASRSFKPADSTDDTLLLNCDLSKPASVSSAFADLRKAWGEPGVVVYNAAAVHFGPELSGSVEDFETDLRINTVSTFVAAKEAVVSFETLQNSAPKTFLYTGNALNERIMSGLLALGVGKAGTAFMIGALSTAYKEKGIRFYYVDERKADGNPKGTAIDGEAHADFFLSLVDGSVDAPWHATFVQGEGYKSFSKM